MKTCTINIYDYQILINLINKAINNFEKQHSADISEDFSYSDYTDYRDLIHLKQKLSKGKS